MINRKLIAAALACRSVTDRGLTWCSRGKSRSADAWPNTSRHKNSNPNLMARTQQMSWWLTWRCDLTRHQRCPKPISTIQRFSFNYRSLSILKRRQQVCHRACLLRWSIARPRQSIRPHPNRVTKNESSSSSNWSHPVQRSIHRCRHLLLIFWRIIWNHRIIERRQHQHLQLELLPQPKPWITKARLFPTTTTARIFCSRTTGSLVAGDELQAMC